MMLKQLTAAFMLLVSAAIANAGDHTTPGNYITSFPMPSLAGVAKHPHIKYAIQFDQEKLMVHVPDNYNDKEPFGLLVSMHVEEDKSTLSTHTYQAYRDKKIIHVTPQNCGNKRKVNERWGLAVLAALSIKEQYKIDSNRVYAGGLYDGARISNLLVMLQPDVFAGAVLTCGAAFHQPVENTHPASPRRPQGKYFIDPRLQPEEVERAKESLRFAFITNSDNPFHGDVMDIVINGYEKQKYYYRLFDLQTGNTDVHSAETMAAAITFLDGAPKRPAAAKPADAASDIPLREKPSWASKDQAQWPVLALHNNIRLKNFKNYTGGTSFLMRMPNDAVVAVSVHHLIEDAAPKAEEYNDVVLGWNMNLPMVPTRRVSLGKLAMKTPVPPKLDLLIIAVPQLSSWPAEVLAPRPKHVAVGDKVFVVDVRRGKQSFYATTVTQADRKDRTFHYQANPTFQSGGLSGAPIVDENGYLVGIHQGRVGEGDNRQDGIALDLSYVTEWADVPAPAKAVTRAPETPATRAAPVSEKPMIIR